LTRLTYADFQPWSGGRNPAPGKRVRVFTRRGKISHAMSGLFWWGRASDPKEFIGALDAFTWFPSPGARNTGNEIIGWMLDPSYTPHRQLTGQFTPPARPTSEYDHLP
jgi:hypothetical protein